MWAIKINSYIKIILYENKIKIYIRINKHDSEFQSFYLKKKDIKKLFDCIYYLL